MFDISDELRALVAILEERQVDYALCGGMAMAVHGQLRATIDIDLLIPSELLEDVLSIAKPLGYNIRGKEMSFADGAVEIRRVSKIDPEDGEPQAPTSPAPSIVTKDAYSVKNFLSLLFAAVRVRRVSARAADCRSAFRPARRKSCVH